MYAIIESCGKQYKVTKGDIVFFEKFDVEEGKKITFSEVVLVSDDKNIQVGTPYVKDVKVEGKVISHGKGKKIIVYKMKPKKNYRRKQGHRQPYTKIEITEIKLGSAKEVVAEAKETEKKETVKSEVKKTETKNTEQKVQTKKVEPKATTKKEVETK